jgi:hypothetical protein
MLPIIRVRTVNLFKIDEEICNDFLIIYVIKHVG